MGATVQASTRTGKAIGLHMVGYEELKQNVLECSLTVTIQLGLLKKKK